jgi:hypothetical protein
LSRSIVRGRLCENLSALKSIELLLVEISEPVVINLLSITEEGVTYLVTNGVANIASTNKESPFSSSQLSISKIGEKGRSISKESSKTKADNANLCSETDKTAFCSEEFTLGKEVSLWLVDDLISRS